MTPSVPDETRFPLRLWGWDDWTVDEWQREPADQGYHSHTYLLGHAGDRYVLKVVPAAEGPKFTDGLAVAEYAQAHGVPSGAPIRTSAGELTAYDEQWCWALLEFLDGDRVDTEN